MEDYHHRATSCCCNVIVFCWNGVSQYASALIIISPSYSQRLENLFPLVIPIQSPIEWYIKITWYTLSTAVEEGNQ